jgi:hypothetical protein
METPIGFDATDCPKSMTGAGQLPLLISPTISNVKLYHVLIDGGVALNLISLATPHHKWMETLIGFDATDCPKSMAGVGQLLLLVSPTITNVKLYYVLIDGGVALNLISLAAL